MTISLAMELLASFESVPEIAAGIGEAFRRSARGETVAAGTAEIVSGADALASIESEWRAIERLRPQRSPFQSFAVAEAALAAHAAHGQTPHYVVVRDCGSVAAILPLVATRMAGLKVLRFLGDPLIQYGDAVLAGHGREAHLEQALLAARGLGADVALLRKVRADAPLSRVLARHAQVSSSDASPFVDLAAEDAVAARDARELRRLRRRLAERGELRLVITRDAQAVGCIGEALALKRRWLTARGLTSLVVGDAAWETALADIARAEAGLVACARLEVGDRLAAIEVALVQDGRWHAFLGAIDPDFAKFGPGQVQMAETIAHCRAEGLSAYDLLAPADAFKRAIAPREVAIDDYALPLSVKGQLAAQALRLAPQARTMLGRLPPPVRAATRAVLGLR